MPIVNQDRWSHVQFFSEHDFLELGTTSSGAKIIQIGTEVDEPIVAVAHTDDPRSEDLNPVELYSLLKFSYVPGEYTFYDQPKKVVQNVKTIHKYSIPANGEFSLELPIDAEILMVKLQKSQPCIWVLLDTGKPKYKRNFSWIRTGEPIEHKGLVYIKTLLSNDGDRVSHLFELVVKIDYSRLEDLLAAKKWREADRETFDILLKICGGASSPDGSLVHQEGIENLPCSDLRTIDALWVRYSNGHFGYSVQQRIWQSLGGTGETKIESRNDQPWHSFCVQLGWQTAFSQLNFTLKAPVGHLPATVHSWNIALGPVLYAQTYVSLYSRFEVCKT